MNVRALIETIYEAAFIPERWPGVLDDLCRISGSASSTLMLADGITPPRWQSTERTRGLIERLSRTEVWKRPERNPERLVEANVTNEYFHCVNDLMTREQLELDGIYRAFKADGLAWQVGTAIPLPCDATIILTFERNTTEGRHDADHLARLSDVRAHLARAGMVANRLGLQHARGALEAMTAIGIPCALLDQQGRLREINRWMTSGLISTRGGERIVLGDPAGDALLDRVLRGESHIRSIPLPPSQHAPGRVAHVIPLAGAARDIFSGGLSLIVMNVSSGSRRRPDLAILRALFDLSPAESRLAAELATGATLADAAIRCNIQPSTARAYLERIFRKTGCRRQAELVGLLVGMVHAAPFTQEPADQPNE